MSDSSDDDLFCSPRTTKKAKPPPKKKAKTTSILDQVMAADAKTEARVNQLKEMNAASRKDLGGRHHHPVLRSTGIISVASPVRSRRGPRRPSGPSMKGPVIPAWRSCWGVRRCVASVCLMRIELRNY